MATAAPPARSGPIVCAALGGPWARPQALVHSATATFNDLQPTRAERFFSPWALAPPGPAGPRDPPAPNFFPTNDRPPQREPSVSRLDRQCSSGMVLAVPEQTYRQFSHRMGLRTGRPRSNESTKNLRS